MGARIHIVVEPRFGGRTLVAPVKAERTEQYLRGVDWDGRHVEKRIFKEVLTYPYSMSPSRYTPRQYVRLDKTHHRGGYAGKYMELKEFCETYLQRFEIGLKDTLVQEGNGTIVRHGYQQGEYADFHSFCSEVLDVDYTRLDDDAQKAAHVLYNDLTYHDEQCDERRWLWGCDSDVAQEMVDEFWVLSLHQRSRLHVDTQDFER